MKTLLKFLNYFFVTLGILFFGISVFVAYMWFFDPYGVKPIVKAVTSLQPAEVFNDIDESKSNNENSAENSVDTADTMQSTGSTASDTTDANPLLSAEQEAQVRAFGIDPAKLPQEITPEMESCFAAELGEARVAEIKAGASPSAAEFFQARGCF